MLTENYVCKIFLMSFLSFFPFTNSLYKIGVGRADCTGPSAEVVFMGYAKSSQKGCGIHLRQFSRAFIFDDGVERIAYVSVDAGMMAHGIVEEVLNRLSKVYNNTYTESNLVLSGTHTHGAPGGFLMDFMYDIPSYGFIRQTFDALVSGITTSIVRAHENMVDGRVFLSTGELLGANINRSPMSYLLNPEGERAKYKYNVDKELVQFKLIRASDNSLMGAINWFAIHPTSMNNTNCLVTSDNVGYASILLEKSVNNMLVGQGPFVGAFGSSNLGDVSPNIEGPRCINTGYECEMRTSTCDGLNQFCIASGPGRDMFESTRIIARKLFEKAKRLLEESNTREVTGPIAHVQQFVDMPEEKALFMLPNGTVEEVHGCLPAMGYSFAAGTTDGPGEFDFAQGMRSSKQLWNTVRDLIFKPTPEDIACHYPKPILINSGRISSPYEWQPRIVSTQLLQLGDIILIAVPGEFTTMSGRRLRKVVEEAVINGGGSKNTKAIIAGLSNVYTSYITTPEEYRMQRYEGASTIFGPHTLTIYLKIYRNLAQSLLTKEQLEAGPRPPNLSSQVISLFPGVMFDTAGLRHSFGDCIKQPPYRVWRGMTVEAKFVAGHPRNNIMQEGSFLTVEKLFGNKHNWKVVATDADWETKFIWRRTSNVLGGSQVIIEWETSPETPVGIYRIRHFGHYKSFFGGIYPYVGSTHMFEVE